MRPPVVEELIVGATQDAVGMTGDGDLRVLGYVRVSTDMQDTGAAAQVRALQAAAEPRGWALTIVQEQATSGASMVGRPRLAAALEELRAHRFDALAVAKLDRVSRSVADFSALLAQAGRQGWALVCLDLNVDTSTPTGAAMAHVAVAFAELERRRIGERISDAMSTLTAQGRHMGRPSGQPPAILDHVHQLRTVEGLSLAAIADQLNADAVPTATGTGVWHGSTVRYVLASAAYRARCCGVSPRSATDGIGPGGAAGLGQAAGSEAGAAASALVAAGS